MGVGCCGVKQIWAGACYDEGALEPWGHLAPLSKTALSPEMQRLRHEWSIAQLRLDRPPHWYYRHCVWVDPNHTILTIDPRSVFDAQQASYGRNKPRWISPDARMSSRNLRSSPYAEKQARHGDRKVWWHLVLTRGVVHFEVMGAGWRQTGRGQADFIDRLDARLPELLGEGTPLPRVVVSDRGPGFYNSNGSIVAEYRAALRRHGFHAYAGDDARGQPADVPDALLHERAAAWVKTYMRRRPIPKTGSLDSKEAVLRERLRECAAHINARHDVVGLCHAFPKRLKELRRAKGARLRH